MKTLRILLLCWLLLLPALTVTGQMPVPVIVAVETNGSQWFGINGGATQWLAFDARGTAQMRIDTIGSAMDTILTVYTWPDTELPLIYLTSDDNGAPDGIRSVVQFPAVSGTIYYVAVHGVHGAEGAILLNWVFGWGPTNCGIVPIHLLVRVGGSVTLPPACDGNASPAPRYQWLYNGQPIGGATSRMFSLANFQAGQAGRYSVVVSNGLGMVTNEVAEVAEEGHPSIAAQVVPPHSMVEGKTLQEWSAAWWQWVYTRYATNHPWFDQTGADAYEGQSGPVFYLVGASGATRKLTRTITLTADKYLFFPLINYLNAAAEGEDPWGTTVEDFYDAGTRRVLGIEALHASVDGVALTNLCYTTGQPVTNLYAHREVAPEFSVWFPPTNNIVQYWGFNYAGFMDPAISDGYWIMLAPLSPGSHVVRFGGVFPPPGRFVLDFTYQINPMKLASVAPLTNGLKRLSFTAPVGQVCVLQASTNLVHWTDLATNTITDNPAEFTDPDAPRFSHRFYRVLKQP